VEVNRFVLVLRQQVASPEALSGEAEKPAAVVASAAGRNLVETLPQALRNGDTVIVCIMS
jgi:hypothetical protein